MHTKFRLLIQKPHLYVAIFFLIYLIIGISVYKDYGISWDEPSHREIAAVSAKYLLSIFRPDFQPPQFASLPALSEYSARQYGVVFDLPMYAADMLLGYNGKMPEAYYLRHLFNFFLFYISVFFLFLIVKNRFGSMGLGLAAALFLILSPRIFADSFYGKDVVFLSLFIICIYFFVEHLKRKTVTSAVLFAFASALLVDQRITGIIIPFLAVVMSLIDAVKQDRPVQHLPKMILLLCLYLVSFCVFMVLFWPYLWENPLNRFIDAFTVMKKYAVFSYDVLYWGEYIKSTAVPWHYILVWILMTTPLIYIFFYLFGAGSIFWMITKNRLTIYSDENEQQDFLFMLLFFVPLFAVIVLQSALYDGWRHMYFLYAPFILISMSGFNTIFKQAMGGHSIREYGAAILIAFVVTMNTGGIAYYMIKNHPFQNIYFNWLAGSNAGQKFELDYWGLSFRQGLEYIVLYDKSPVIHLSTNVIPPLLNNAVFLKKHDLDRLRLTDAAHADYYLTNYRWHPKPYPLNDEIFSISVDNLKIFSVFKLR